MNIDPVTDKERLAVLESQVKDIKDLLTQHITQQREQFKELSKHFDQLMANTVKVQNIERDLSRLSDDTDKQADDINNIKWWINTFKYIGGLIVALLVFILQQILSKYI